MQCLEVKLTADWLIINVFRGQLSSLNYVNLYKSLKVYSHEHIMNVLQFKHWSSCVYCMCTVLGVVKILNQVVVD